jgi:hypothetical protein
MGARYCNMRRFWMQLFIVLRQMLNIPFTVSSPTELQLTLYSA